MNLNLLRANADGLLQLFTEFLEPEIHVLTANNISNGYIQFNRDPVNSSGVLLFVDQAVQYNKAWTLGSLTPTFEIDTVNTKRCYFKNVDAVEDENAEHTGLDSIYEPQEGMVFIAFFKSKEDGVVLKLDSKPKITFGYNQDDEEILIDTWLEIQGSIIRNPDECSVIFYDNEENVYINTTSTTQIDGTYHFAEFETLDFTKNYTIEVQIKKDDIEYECRYPVGMLSEYTITIGDILDFQGYVWIDESSGYSGVNHPKGTVSEPSNNISDALTIANKYNLKEILIRNMIQTLPVNLSIAEYFIKARSPHQATLILDGGDISGAHFKYLSVTGESTGRANYEDCILYDIENLEGTIKNCLLDENISLGTSTPIMLVDCYSEECMSIPVIDFQNNDVNLVIRNFSGFLKIRNKTGSKAVCIDMVSGSVEVESSCTGKNITIRGANSVTDTNNHSVIDDTTLSTIISLGESTLNNLKDVRGLLNENVKQVVEYDPDGNIQSIQSIQYQDKTMSNYRKSWTRSLSDREGRRVKDTSKVED